MWFTFSCSSRSRAACTTRTCLPTHGWWSYSSRRFVSLSHAGITLFRRGCTVTGRAHWPRGHGLGRLDPQLSTLAPWLTHVGHSVAGLRSGMAVGVLDPAGSIESAETGLVCHSVAPVLKKRS